MNLSDWLYIKHFKPSEFNQPNKLNFQLLREVDALRNMCKKPIYVTPDGSYRKGDPREHGKGNALDVVCPDVELMEFYLLAERFKFNGIGVYPKWKWNNETVGGLHLDVRKLAHPYGARWMGLKIDNANQYITLNTVNLKTYGVV